jgi:hypothetical protein
LMKKNMMGLHSFYNRDDTSKWKSFDTITLVFFSFQPSICLFFWVAISNSTITNSKPSETRQILISTHFNLDSHKLETFVYLT